ncbi:hypothetical protein J3E68DRAFT_393966 [Trichoderma sp. SZMC 28012]
MPPICFSPGVALCRALTLVPVQATPLGDQDSSGRWLMRHQLRSQLAFQRRQRSSSQRCRWHVKRPWALGCYQRSFHRRRPREPIDILTDLPKREAIDKGPLLRPLVIVFPSASLVRPFVSLSAPSHPPPRDPKKRQGGC